MNNNKKELHIGFMGSREVAAWLGLKYTSYRQAINRYLKRLIPYCKFAKEPQGITISKIICPTYIGEINSKDISSFKAYVRKQKRIQKQYFPLLSQEKVIKDLAQTYNTLTPNELSLKVELLMKKCGSGRNIWSIYNKETNQHSFLTPEEDDLFTQCIQEGIKRLSTDELLDEMLLIYPSDEDGEFYTQEEKEEMAEATKDFFERRLNRGIAIFKEKTGKDILLCKCYELTP